ncbi:DNA topoisomerase II [Lentinula aciculospora]|uniref:DNA topoisomerase 2 n=1 Tax=Lentinula aciculospora TaxID=153920 RepID=A0A9W9APS9_9AGAR|nr:DNA topoisomerase II [Lentinula aciculospora]
MLAVRNLHTWTRITRVSSVTHVALQQRLNALSISTSTTRTRYFNMSSSEGENFEAMDISDSDTDFHEPAPKKATKTKTSIASKTKVTTSKAAEKAKAAPKKKVLADHHNNAEEDTMDEDERGELDDNVPGLQTKDAPVRKTKSVSDTFQRLTQLEHILKRPDSYIGSVEHITQAMWTYDANTKRMVHRDVKYVPGFFKIVDEILVNAADNKINDPNMDVLKVNIDVDEGTISVYNNGKGIPIEIHSREKMYIPELVFGNLLSGSNYDDDEKKLTGGRNGYGAKLANIYSHEFTVETSDKSTSQKYKQTWTENMSKCGKAKITKNAKGEEFTRVTFRPDLQRFGMDSIDEDTAGLLRRRVYDMAGTVKDVKVFLNDERLKIKNFKSYVELYLNSATAEAAEQSGGAAQNKMTVVYEQISPRWEVAFAVSDGNFMHVSFANSISTSKGGTHVNLIADQIAKNLIAAIGKKNKAATVKAGQIKNHMWVFINALIENPTFDSQTKETLTLPSSKFGTRPVLSEDFMKKVQKSPIVDNILNWAKFKADQQIKKTDGSKRSRLTGLPKLSDANNAGTKNAKDCTLILTEGDSAKALAIAGLGVVGRNNFGVFPLRGKLLNVREARHDQIMKNEEIQNIKKIMGLQHNKDYSDVSSLRYGRLMIMTDQDHDGSHIKGLLINFVDHFYPSLLKIPDFLVEFVTPIIRASKGKQHRDFFTIPEYEQWAKEVPGADKWDTKYFKGLGTSTDADARGYFSNMAKHVIPFAPTQEGDRELIELAFSKKKADDRKEWLRQFKPGTFLDHELHEIPYSDFVNKELILFSMADNIRSIPSIADGLKPGQRKVIWACFKRNLKKEIKVVQLVGYVSEHAAYHHGDMSLTQTIVALAQDFVGSNNLNIMNPSGQFGTRDQGGKDHASGRYINTLPMPIARSVFHSDDDALLNAQFEDNSQIEPEFYMPVVPMVLINGAEGIGTGWSTNIPGFNPIDIVANIRRLMDGEELVPMHPWWRGFKGEIKLTSKNKYDVFGIVTKIDDTTVEITELPIHKWTQNFKAELETMMVGEKGEGSVKNYQEHHANENVHFIVQMDARELTKAEEKGLPEYFKLVSRISTSNMICFDLDGKIRKYDSPEAILEEFYPARLSYYQKRKDYLSGEMTRILDRLNSQARFIQMIVDKELIVSARKKLDIIADLKEHKFPAFPKKSKANTSAEEVDAETEEEDKESNNDYDYLLNMPIYSLTKEKIEKLRKQAADKEAEIMVLLRKSPKDLWNEDLDQFLEGWRKTEDEFQQKMAASTAAVKKGKRKQAVLQTRKSLGGGGRRGNNESDDDFQPVKPAAKKKAPAALATKPQPRTMKMKPKKEDSDGDEDASDFPKKAVPMKVVARPKIESNSDIEIAESQKTTRHKGRAKVVPKRKSPDIEEDDSEAVVLQPSKKKKKIQDFFGKTSSSTDVASGFSNGSSSESKIAPQARKVSKSMKPASPPKSKKARPAVIKSDSEDDMNLYDDLPKPPPRAPSSRAARGKTKAYIDIASDEEEGDGSLFVDDD